MKKSFFFLVLLFGCWVLSAQSPRTILPVSSFFYDMVDYLCYESGMAQPDTARPWSFGELQDVLSRIDYASLSPAGRNVYDTIKGTLEEDIPLVKKDSFSFDSSISLSPEGFYHFELEDTLGETAQSYEWRHGYEERQSFLTIPLEFWYADRLYMTTIIEAKEEHMTVTSPGTPDVAQNYSNIIFDDPNARIDLYFPFRAGLSLGGEWWDLFFGRDSLSWGNGESGNLLLSDYSDFYDYIMLKLRSEIFTFTSVYTVMDHYLYDGTDITYSAFIGHRLDASFWNNRIGLAVVESVTFANYMPELLRDLNYLMVFHNWTIPERTNSLMSIEVTVNPWKYLNIYGQLAMDEFTTTYESERTGGGGPPIFGYMAGAKGACPLGYGYLSLTGEWVLTNPWLYNRRATPFYYNTRRIWSLTTDSYEYVLKPLGYEYGCDSIVYYGEVSYRVPGIWAAGLDVTRLVQGGKRDRYRVGSPARGYYPHRDSGKILDPPPGGGVHHTPLCNGGCRRLLVDGSQCRACLRGGKERYRNRRPYYAEGVVLEYSRS